MAESRPYDHVYDPIHKSTTQYQHYEATQAWNPNFNNKTHISECYYLFNI